MFDAPPATFAVDGEVAADVAVPRGVAAAAAEAQLAAALLVGGAAIRLAVTAYCHDNTLVTETFMLPSCTIIV